MLLFLIFKQLIKDNLHLLYVYHSKYITVDSVLGKCRGKFKVSLHIDY